MKKEDKFYIDMNACAIGHAIGSKAGTAEQECWCDICELYVAMLLGKDHAVLNDGSDYIRIVYVRR